MTLARAGTCDEGGGIGTDVTDVTDGAVRRERPSWPSPGVLYWGCAWRDRGAGAMLLGSAEQFLQFSSQLVARCSRTPRWTVRAIRLIRPDRYPFVMDASR